MEDKCVFHPRFLSLPFLVQKVSPLPLAGDVSSFSLRDREEPPPAFFIKRKPYPQDTETPP